MSALVVLCAVLFGLGAFLLVVALRGVRWTSPRQRTREPRWSANRLGVRLGLGLVGAVAALVVTGWPVGIVLAAAGGFWVPSALGARSRHGLRLARLEALASWTEQLRDVMAAAAGLEQAIVATAAFAPAALRVEISGLAAALEAGTSPRTALRRFADQVDDPAGDLVVAALILASESSPRQLGDLLGRLASSSRDTVTMRLRVETGRARTRSSVRLVTTITVAFSVGIVVFNSTYVEVYRGPFGQLVLVVVASFFAGAYWWLARATVERNEGRFLAAGALTETVR